MQQLQRVLEETDQINRLVHDGLADYLTRIRVLLDGCLNQAVFQLVTDQRPEAFLALEDDQRSCLRQRLAQLTARSREQLTMRRLVEKGLARIRRPMEAEANIPDTQGGDAAVTEGVARPEIRLELQNRPLLANFNPGRLLSGSQPWSDGELDVTSDDGEFEETPEEGDDGLDPGFDQPLPIPSEPAAARRWLGLADHALSLHLLELSDAVNRELMALDLLAEVPDPALLDAALEGQADARPAPPNLLRLSWPFETDQLAGVLLRSADLEFLDPPLRSQRQVLRRLDRQLARMARRHHHWQRRTAVRQAEEAWQQSNPRPPKPGAG